jgi:hypothetical protein
LSYEIVYWLAGSCAAAALISRFHVSPARGQPLCPAYDDARASLSNSYALIDTLMASTQFEVERRSAMNDEGEPPSMGRPKSLFRIGRNSRGNWVVQDQSGLCGGLFVDRAEAVKFAMFENGNRPQAVIMVPDILERDMSGKPHAASGTRLPLARAA